MTKKTPPHSRVELLRGTLDMLILRRLQWGPRHWPGDPAQIASEWKASELNRRAKYYRLTACGKKQLASEQSKWKLLVKTIARVMRTT